MRKLLTVLAAIGGVAASAVALGPAAAADVTTSGFSHGHGPPGVQACARSTITTGPYGGVGTTATKSSTSSCNDLNLVYADDTSVHNSEGYAGRYYRSSTGTWITGTRGYIGVNDGSYAIDQIVLVTDLRDGTRFTVASLYDSGDTVQIAH